MNEAVLFPADQAVWLSAVALKTKGLPSHCHHSWKPAFSERKRLNAAPPAENEHLTQFHYTQHKGEMALSTMTPPGREPLTPPFLPMLQRTRDIQGDLWVLVRKWWKKRLSQNQCLFSHCVLPSSTWGVCTALCHTRYSSELLRGMEILESGL